MFPVWFLAAAIYGGLVLVAAAALVLAGLWLADHRGRRLW
jgi:hypothetical protein